MRTCSQTIVGLPAKTAFCAVLLAITLASAQAESAQWHSKTTGPGAQLTAFFPAPNTISGSPHLLVVPLLGPQRRLLPDGRLRVWVGLNDGNALANATVTLRVPATGNALVSNGSRVTEITVQTNALGIAEVKFAAPDVPPGSTGNGEGGEPPAS